MSEINQKEYLKKYLSIGKDLNGKKKKKRKKIKNENCNRLKIIDDDLDVFESAVQEDLMLGDNEDAPQIVEIIDERPISHQTDDKTNELLWIPIGGVKTEENVETPSANITNNLKISIKSTKKKHRVKPLETQNIVVKQERMSPEPRVENSMISSDATVKIEEVEDSPSSSIQYKERDGDISPPRRSRNNVDEDGDISPPRKKLHASNRDRDMSPPRRKQHKSSRDISPQRKRKDSPTRKRTNLPQTDTRDISPPRKRTTLDGKTAGLQNAEELVKESREIRKREDEHFRNIPSEISGANASTIVRDRKTGRVRNLHDEKLEALEKKKTEDENVAKYSRWGRGLKQVEDAASKRAEEMNEMNKPLARYANDEDLEQYLKEQEREGDPMLAYIRKKKKKKDIEDGVPSKPIYKGEFMPNRFGIRPGHRWDGVDRSNGYEKRWFDVQNSKLAQQEESYKWSTEDM